MHRDNVWVLIGMAAQTLVIGSFGVLKTINAPDKTGLAIFWAIITFFYWVITRKINGFFVGMILQPLIINVLASLGIIISPEKLLIAGGFSLLFIAGCLISFLKSI